MTQEHYEVIWDLFALKFFRLSLARAFARSESTILEVKSISGAVARVYGQCTLNDTKHHWSPKGLKEPSLCHFSSVIGAGIHSDPAFEVFYLQDDEKDIALYAYIFSIACIDMHELAVVAYFGRKL